MTKIDKLIRFIESCEVELFPADDRRIESVLESRWRKDFTIMQRMELYDQAGLAIGTQSVRLTLSGHYVQTGKVA